MSTLVGAASAANGSSSVNTITCDAPAGLASGHVMVAEIGLTQTQDTSSVGLLSITAPAGWVLMLDGLDGTTVRKVTYKKVAGPSEPASYAWSWTPVNCRVSVAIVAYSGAGSPTLAEVAQTPSSTNTHVTPQLTATSAGRLIGAWASQAEIELPVGSTATERADVYGGASGNNMQLFVADQVIGAAGNYTMTAETTMGSTATLVKSLVFLPDSGANVPPTANAGPDQTVEVLGTASLTSAGSTDSDGTIASHLWRIISGGGSLSATNVASPTFTAPATPGVTVIGLRVTDDDGAQSAEDTMTVTSVSTGSYSRPVGDVSRAGWTAKNTSGATVTTGYATIDEATPDNNDYDQAPDGPTYSNEARYQMGPLPDPVDATGYWIEATLHVVSPAVSGTARVRLFNGATNAVLATFEQAIDDTPTAYQFNLTTGEANTVNHADIEIGVAFKDVV